ncbi:hypothetical protein ACWCPT_29360 [Streptomyces sp. NPDC002308]
MITPTATSDLDGLFEDLAGFSWLPGIDQVLNGFRAVAAATESGDLTVDQTQTLLAVLAGAPDGTDLLGVIAHLVTLTATNPGLARIPAHRQKAARQHTERTQALLLDPDLHTPAAEASAAISSY